MSFFFHFIRRNDGHDVQDQMEIFGPTLAPFSSSTSVHSGKQNVHKTLYSGSEYDTVSFYSCD